jgi:hypothetical protein
MTPINNTAKITKTASNTGTSAADQVLRDLAYVLKLTRRVKEEMTADRARTESPVARSAEGALVA